VKRKGTVFVGLSGGVDSAVSAALLKRAGYEVVGVFMRTWHPEFLECNEEEERRDAIRVAAALDIPFLTFDFEKVYKREVADYMIREYRAGRTPNPDVMCNKEVKFGAFLKEALRRGADYIATGHYANLTPSPSPFKKMERGGIAKQGEVRLLKGTDPAKDQSYFLWTLTQKQLAKVMFPVGHLPKGEVRKLAKKFNLPVAEKKDSQGICFLGEVDLKKFLKYYIREKKGKVINEKGETIGRHDGVFFHTLGARHGFTITKKTPRDKPYYVVGKDAKKNILIVSEKNGPARPAGGDISLFQSVYKMKSANWIADKPNPNKKYSAQIRYHGEKLPCQVSGDRVTFQKPLLAAPGQSLVIYDGEVCLGGGVII